MRGSRVASRVITAVVLRVGRGVAGRPFGGLVLDFFKKRPLLRGGVIFSLVRDVCRLSGVRKFCLTASFAAGKALVSGSFITGLDPCRPDFRVALSK